MHTYEFNNTHFRTGANEPLVEGVIVKKVIGSFLVNTGDSSLRCDAPHGAEPEGDARSERRGARQPRRERRPGRTAHDARPQGRSAPDLAVGDRVLVEALAAGEGRIARALPRRNALSRRAAGWTPGGHAAEQVIAANLDQVVAVLAAAQPAPKWNLLDRYLVSAEAAGVPALICLTKADLALDAAGQPGGDLQQALDEYRAIGYPVVVTSAADGHGLDALRRALSGRVSALVGKSGVGKTSLLNALQPGLGLRVRQVSQATEKGQHTTTHLEMFALEGGGALVDTPGMREFGLWQVDESDLAQYFPEMRPWIGQCRFGLDCRHDEEPGCAVRQAVMSGKISPRRYKSFQRLRVEQ